MGSILKKVKRFEAAVRAHEMKGAQMPEDHEAIELRYQQTKKSLLKAIGIIANGEKDEAK